MGRCAVEHTKLFLIVDDRDAPRSTFTHWVLFDIPKFDFVHLFG